MNTVDSGITVRAGDVTIHKPTPDIKQKDKLVNTVVKDAMQQAKLSFADITHYEVVVGPGSWTGARVGVAIIKAYCLAHPKPVHALHADGTLLMITTGAELEPLYDREYVIDIPNKP